ncbi:MAG: hypothetical protein II304_04365 [Bacteroidales bacterium]|nr:hypothetical protein [Bacteroidales bacterium]
MRATNKNECCRRLIKFVADKWCRLIKIVALLIKFVADKWCNVLSYN